MAHATFALARDLEVERIVQTLTDEATALCRAGVGAFFSNVLEESATSGNESFSPPRAILAPTLRGESIVRVDDVRQDARYAAIGGAVASYLAVPVISRAGGVLGGLFFAHEAPAVFTARDESVIAALAVHAALAIDHARTFAVVRASDAARAAAEERERAARERAEEANRQLGVVAHELRAPLSAIVGWLRMVETGNVDEHGRAKALATVSRNADALHGLVEDLLDVSRASSGTLRIDVQPLDLGEVLRSAVDAVKPAATAKQIALSVDIEREATTMRGDAARIRQVVWNLLNNAVKFTPCGGAVEVTLVAAGRDVEICVRDDGQHISAEQLPFVFDRFRQRAGAQLGLGLGLAIVKHVVELHGGRVSAESSGRGATFRVRLPMAGEPLMPVPAVSEARPARRSPIHVPASVRGQRVLVVDDDRDAIELLSELLGSYGIEPLTASSAEQAMEVLERERPDVIVSDIGMPVEDGYSLIARIRNLPDAQLASTPATALTAFARKEERAKALMSGFDHHLAKPVDPNELFAVLGSMTAARRRPA